MSEAYLEAKPQTFEPPGLQTPTSSGATGQSEDGTQTPRTRIKRPFFVLGTVLALMVIAVLIYWLLTRNYETTDDAEIDGNSYQIELSGVRDYRGTRSANNCERTRWSRSSNSLLLPKMPAPNYTQ